ncbi:MAG: hypothetical protein DMF89_21725 [Acidobacteria bacterium]|nr:MAG: hypothetical protein DMF89_21725 [Acidobacteriota bacterium]
MGRERVGRVAALACVVMLLPATALAQGSSIAGVVRDSTGGVLPGVTVEAASPVLIEKVRTVVTDDQGLYRITDLRPGTYTVTFTLAGFGPVKRDGLELTTNFTATVNAELKVGGLAETITVSGQTPVVDVENVVQQRIISRETLDTLPTAKSIQSFGALIPGMQVGTNQDVGGTSGDSPVGTAIHGGRGSDQHIFYDGMRTNNLHFGGGGANQSIFFNPASIQEISLEVGNLGIQSETGGIVINVIPKDGGNGFSGSVVANGANGSMQSDNLTDELRARGLDSTTTIRNVFDLNGSLGGPIVKDKLWFYAGVRRWGNENYVAGLYFSKDPLAWTYTPDANRPALDQNLHSSANARMTWQVNKNNKISFALERQNQCLCYTGVPGSWAPSNTTPEASQYTHNFPSSYGQLKWKDVVSNKLLVEAGVSVNIMNWQVHPEPGVGQDVIPVTELTTGLTYRAATFNTGPHQDEALHTRSTYFTGAVAYVTGSHNFKVGTNLSRSTPKWTYDAKPLDYLFYGGAPAALVMQAMPIIYRSNLNAALGTYAQDQWTIKKLTLNLGVRHEYLNADVPEQSMPAGRFVPARDYAAVPNVVAWNELVPRLGAAYDLFGNGKTAIKATLNKYLNAEASGASNARNPTITQVAAVVRAWGDANGNYNPDCDLLNPDANGECGPMSDRNFGKQAAYSTTYDPAVTHGWGQRNNNWETTVGIQQELRSGLSASATYFRRWFGNYAVADNRAVAPSDYDPYCVTAPVDPRLPGGGGNQICGFYDLNPAKFGQVDNYVTFADHYGKLTDVYTGVDLTVNMRLPRGATLQGGLNTGREVSDNCDVVGKVDMSAATLPVTSTSFVYYFGGGLPSLSGVASPSTLYCHIAPPFQTDVKLSGLYPLPWWGVALSATFQSIPGPPIVATAVYPNALIEPSLGRPLGAGVNGTATVQLVAPGTLYGDRLNQVDLRVMKTVTAGKTRIKGSLDLYNLFNVSPVLALNNQYGPAWQRPLVVLPGRFVKVGVQVDF